MCIRDRNDFERLRAVGRIVRAALDAMVAAVRPGVTTAELNAIGAQVMRRHGARSAPMLVYDYPAETCISVNDEIVHGIPGGRVIEKGDLVTCDVTAEKDGYMADAAMTVGAGATSKRALELVGCARRAFARGIAQARPGATVRDIGRAVEHQATREGFAVVRALTGHGIGRTIHEDPMVPNFDDPYARARLVEGLVITVEPLIAMGSGEAVEDSDGWTVRTIDRALSAHHEETIVVTRDGPVVLTAA